MTLGDVTFMNVIKGPNFLNDGLFGSAFLHVDKEVILQGSNHRKEEDILGGC